MLEEEKEVTSEKETEKQPSVKILSKDDILGADDNKVEPVEVPEWGGVVLIRTISGKERDHFESSCFVGRGRDRRENFANLRARLVRLCAVNEKGEMLFNDDDVKKLGTKSAAALDRVFAKAQKLNGLTNDDVEELTKNSESDQSDDSISD